MKRLFILNIILLLLVSSCVNKRYSVRALKNDTDFFFKTLRDVHPNINAHYPQIELTNDSLKLYKSLHKMNRFEYYRVLKPIMAKIADGHTRLKLSVWIDVINQNYIKPLYFPISVIFHNDTAYVVNDNKNDNKNDNILPFGTKIISINNIPINEIIRKVLNYDESYVSDCFTEFNERIFSKSLRDELGILNDSFLVRYSTTGLNYKDTLIIGREKMYSDMKRYRWNQKYKKKNLLNIIKTEQNNSFKYEIYEDTSYAYLNYYKCSKDTSNNALLKRFFSYLKEFKINNLIIDARYNSGGTTQTTEQLLRYIGNKPYSIISKGYIKYSEQLIKKRKYLKKDLSFYKKGKLIKYYDAQKEISQDSLLFNGNIYVLAGTETFSAGANFVAVVKDCKLGTIVGQETGGLASGYGDYLIFKLPKTRLRLQVATKFLIRPNGCTKPEGVIPDIYVNKTLEDKLYLKDIVLEQTIELIKKKYIW